MTLWRVRATVDDRPGFLSVLTASLALKAINILAVQVHTTEAGAVDDFLIDAPDQLTEGELLAAVERGRGRDAWVTRADVRGLVDPPTQALGLANRLIQDPLSLGDVLAAATGGEVSWRAAPGTAGFGAAGGELWLPDPAGGCYLITRDGPEFTPAEYARAHALADLAATASRQAAAQASLLLADGTEITVRLATEDDLDAVRAMHERCSPTTRYHRYLGRPAVPSSARVARLLRPAGGVTLLASADRVVAMAYLVGDGPLAQAAVLVEDGWQQRGIGTALVRRLATFAVASGCAALVLHCYAENIAVPRLLGRLGHSYTMDRDGALLTITIPLQPEPVAVTAGHVDQAKSRAVTARRAEMNARSRKIAAGTDS